MNSLRWRLFAGSVAAFTLLLGGGGALAYIGIKERLYASFDRSLVQRAVSLIPMIKEEEGVIEIDWLEYRPHPPGHQEGTDRYAIWKKAANELLAQSDEAATTDLPRTGGPPDRPVVAELPLPDGSAARRVGIEFHARIDLEGENGEPIEVKEKGPAIQMVLARKDTVQPTLGAIRGMFAGIWAGGTLLSALVTWWLVRKNLRPLDELREQIGRKGVMSGQKVSLDRPPAELEPVVAELNRLLERVERAILRERTLTSNVAHELRTPVAGILSTLEVALGRSRPAEEYREAMDQCFDIAKRMHWLVGNLLSITRIEANHLQLQSLPVPLHERLREWWEPFAKLAAARGLRVSWSLVLNAVVTTDAGFLRVVMSNLYDNAVSHGRANGVVRIAADAQGAITVCNLVEDMDAAHVQHVFDPFWRNSESRDAGGGHVGLGLNLCQKIVGILGGRITAHFEESERVFEVRVELGRREESENGERQDLECRMKNAECRMKNAE